MEWTQKVNGWTDRGTTKYDLSSKNHSSVKLKQYMLLYLLFLKNSFS